MKNSIQISKFKLCATRRILALAPQFQIGYTLVELMVALGIMGFIAAIALYSVRSFNDAQVVVNAQKDFVSNLRAVQNKVDNGADSSNYKVLDVANNQPSYVLDSVTVTLPAGVKVYTVFGERLYVCLANPNVLATYPACYAAGPGPGQLGKCGQCTGKIFACHGLTPISSGNRIVTFTKGSFSKQVVINGSGMRVTSIDAQ